MGKSVASSRAWVKLTSCQRAQCIYALDDVHIKEDMEL